MGTRLAKVAAHINHQVLTTVWLPGRTHIKHVRDGIVPCVCSTEPVHCTHGKDVWIYGRRTFLCAHLIHIYVGGCDATKFLRKHVAWTCSNLMPAVENSVQSVQPTSLPLPCATYEV